MPVSVASASRYVGRDTQYSDLLAIVTAHLDELVERAQQSASQRPIPSFVEKQLRIMLRCGDFTEGFLRLECASCRAPRIVPLS